jgi:hypothetical protein
MGREPVELERLDMRERSSVGESGNTRDRRARAEVQKQAVGDKAAGAAAREPRFDRPRPYEASFGEKKLEVRDLELPAVDGGHPSTISRLR